MDRDKRFYPTGVFMTKYGPITIHQNGKFIKHLAAIPVGKSSSYVLENVRLSCHLERAESQEKLEVETRCVVRFPGHEGDQTFKAPCEIRVGHIHGSAVVPSTRIEVNFEAAEETTMEVEFYVGEESVAKWAMPVDFPVDPNATVVDREDSTTFAVSPA
jgi:hypothetical protein